MTHFAVRAGTAARRASALCCDVQGYGTPLLLIHGIAATGAMFGPILPTLAAHHQVIVPDLRGHGRSRQLGGTLSVEQFASDLHSVLNLLGVRRCIVLGYGHGGAVAQQLAHTAPERVKRLVLACAPAAPGQSAREYLAGALLPSAMRLLGTQTLGSLTGHQITGLQDRNRVADAARALLQFDSRSWLHTVTCPTLILQAERDTIVPRHHAAALAERLPNATLRTVPNAGHWMLSTHTDAFLEALLPWLGE